MVIRNELRKNEHGETEIWANLEDILHWLDSLAADADSSVEVGAAVEIRKRLFEQAKGALETLGEG
jgi:hypothetical protein